MTRINYWDPKWLAAVQAELDPLLEEGKASALMRAPEQEEPLAEDSLDEPMDPDIEAIAGYLMFELPPEERAAVEDRLENDAEFRKKVAPLVWLYETPISFTPPSERPGPRTRKATATKDTGEVIEFVAAKPIRRRMRWIIALGIVVPILMGGLVFAGFRYMVKAISGTVVARGSANGGMSPLYYFTNPIRHDATDGNRIVDVRPGVRIELLKGSVLTVRGENQDKLIWAFPGAALDGDAIVELSAPLRNLVIATPGGFIGMTQGRYAISCPPGCTEARVTIESGQVKGTGEGFTSGLVLVKNYEVRRATDTTGFLTLPPKK